MIASTALFGCYSRRESAFAVAVAVLVVVPEGNLRSHPSHEPQGEPGTQKRGYRRQSAFCRQGRNSQGKPKTVYRPDTQKNAMSNPDDLFQKAHEEEEQGNYSDAFQHLLTASQLGHSGSQITLGNYYAEGRGTAKSAVAARSWYERAYNSGSREGAYNLRIDLRNNGELSGAATWLQKAVDLGDGDACVALAELCLDPSQRTGLLRRALLSRPEDITEEARETAESMLADLES